MGLVVHVLQLLAHQLSIDLGGGNIGVAQHLLNGVEVGTVFQQMGGEGMTDLLKY